MNNGFLSKYNTVTNSFSTRHWSDFGSIRTIYEASDGVLWLGTYNKGLVKYIPTTGKIQSFTFSDQDNIPSYVSDIIQDNDILWMATKNGIVKHSMKNNETMIIGLGNNPKIQQDFTLLEIVKLYKSKRGLIYTHNREMIISYNPTTNEYKYYESDIKKRVRLNSFYYASDTLWIGTEDGLMLFDDEQEEFIAVRGNDRPMYNSIRIIIPEKHHLWLGTSQSITKYNKITGQYINYNSLEHCQNIYYNHNAEIQCSNGNIYMGGIQGFTIFNPDSLYSLFNNSNVVLTALYIHNTPIHISKEGPLKQNITLTRDIRLKHHQNILTFEYALLNFTHTEKNMYSYILEGFEQKWHEAGNRRTATYINIPPGKYTFRVKALNSEGFSNESSGLAITILSPFWYRWWFIVVGVIIIIAAIYYLIHYRTKHIEKQNMQLNAAIQERTLELLYQKEELRKINNSKDRLFSIISQDVKTPFTAIANFSRLLINNFTTYSEEKKQELLHQIINSTENALDILENLLQWSRAINNKIQYTPSQQDANNIVQKNIEQLRFAAYNKNIKVISDNRKLFLYADKDMLHIIIHNLLSNAIKYSKQGSTVYIRYKNTEDYAEIEFEDQGIGISETDQVRLFHFEQHFSREGTMGETGTGIGLILCKELISRNNGEIIISSEENKGTKVKAYYCQQNT